MRIVQPAAVPGPQCSSSWTGSAFAPAMLEIGERLAANGYFVLLPDLYYRSGAYEPMDPHSVFTDPEKRKVLMEKLVALATQANIMADTGAFLD
jgi:carboxymethylenebutenolidase